jgi:glycine/D-amino acid oxidase-like deaminating enzyme
MRGSGRPIWDDIASSGDLAALAPTRPSTLPSRVDVLVVGGGVIGLAVAAFCTRSGLDVLLVEREQRLATCASGRAAGGLSPDAHPELGSRWREAARRSLELHRRLDAEWDYGLRTVDLHVVPHDVTVADQGHVDPLRFCAALARRAGSLAVSTTYADARDVRARYTVFATGSAPDHADVAQQSHVKGHLIATAPLSPVMDGFATDGRDLLVLQLPSGHIVAGGTKEPEVDAADVDDAVCSRIGTEMRELIPVLADVTITHRWTCFRPLISDALPIVRRLDATTWCAAGLYSTGILMAPVIADAIVSAITSGTDVPVFA